MVYSLTPYSEDRVEKEGEMGRQTAKVARPPNLACIFTLKTEISVQ